MGRVTAIEKQLRAILGAFEKGDQTGVTMKGEARAADPKSVKARALLKGRHHVATEDIRAVAYPVLRHRIITNFNAEAEGIKPDEIVRQLIEHIPTAESDGLESAGVARAFKDETA